MTRPKSNVTIRDVARVAGVSPAAVSKVLREAYGVSPEMKSKVNAAITQLGYRPSLSARALRGSSYTLGIAIPSNDNSFYSTIINGAAAALVGGRYRLVIAPSLPSADPLDATRDLVDRKVDGILTITTLPLEWLEELGAHTPLVSLGRHDPSLNYDTIVGDDVAGAEMAVRHLYELGHRRIVHVTHPEGEETAPTTPHGIRLASYLRTMREVGLAERIELLHPGGNADEARAALREFLADESEPVGVFAAHDELALGALAAVADLGLDPGRVSVVGYDDIEIARHPLISLTSVNQSGGKMGEIAVRLLLERIAGRAEAQHEVLPPTLIARRSTAIAFP